jgi:hypothetical protein
MKKIFFVLVLVLSLSLILNAQNSNPFASNNAFSLKDSIGNSLKKFNMSPPYNLVSINSNTTYEKFTLEFGAPGYLYFVYWPSSFQLQFYRIDTASGVVTQISTTPYLVGSAHVGFEMSWDRTSNKMYFIYGAGIYTINVYTGVFTFVDTLNPPSVAGVYGVSINNSGSMFGFSSSHKFVRINKFTGDITPVDTFTLNPAYVKGSDFDPLTNNMYILYKNGSNTDVYKVDTANGHTTLTGTFAYSLTRLAIAGGTYIGINQTGTEVPSEFKLMQNYPNPFNPSTNIRFSIPKSEYVNITIYDMLGREAAVLVNEKLSQGNYEVDWNARHGGSSTFPSGVYIYRMSSGNFNETKTMVLVK